jgi:hypothetical protein
VEAEVVDEAAAGAVAVALQSNEHDNRRGQKNQQHTRIE